ncbi:hypothetical protein J1N35_037989 [Gossypium stocksii]|uniref:SWIM-type domain-containing protein n=1 Tax=Gossypium stocksii TaxID=47602 RepID=A0A9D3ULJ9_9ROSI|nr:hypothetical protein J1N35_037989 [Gossypium stocksii]
MKVLSIKYRFCASIDSVTYDSFDIKGARGLRRDDVLPTTSTGEETSYVAADGGSDDKSNVDPPREPEPDGAEVALFSKPEPMPTELKGVQMKKKISDLGHLPYKRRDHASSSLDSGELEVGKDFFNKDSFLGALKQHSIMNEVNYNVVKSKSDKFESKCAVKDGTCSWKIMSSLRKRTGLWEIKKYKGVSQDHPKMDSSMLVSLILPMVKEDPKTSVPVLMSHIRSQLRYTHRLLLVMAQDGYEISKDRFHEMIAILHSVNEEGTDYLCNIPFEQWTQAYDGGLRYGHMTINLAECINFVLKGTRHLPITSVVRETYFRLVALFPKRAASYKGQMQGGHVWCRKNRTCDCGSFDALRYPCAHAIATCQNIRLDPMSYVDDVYKIEHMYNVWRHVFSPVPDERKWSSVSLAPFKLLPDRALRRKPKSRHCSSRIRNNMDIRETTNQQKLCGWCRNPGHTSQLCPNRNG